MCYLRQLEGYALKLSAKAVSGYVNVISRPSSSGDARWQAVVFCPDQQGKISLGTFDKPEEAALAIAKHNDPLHEAAATAEPQVQLQASDRPGASPAPLRRRGAAADEAEDQGEWQFRAAHTTLSPPPIVKKR